MHSANNAQSIRTTRKVLYYQTIDGGDNISFANTVPSVPVTSSMDFMKTIATCGHDKVDTIFFDWPITMWCNYKCSYCPVVDEVTNDFTTGKHSRMHNLTLAKLRTVEETFNVCLTGGEPTLHPEFMEIVQGLIDIPKCQNVSIFTNLSRPTKFFKQLAELKSDKIVILASYHPEFATDKFYSRCVELAQMPDLNFSVHLTLSDNPEYWDRTEQLILNLKAQQILYKPLLLSPTDLYTPKYSREFDQRFDQYLHSTGKNYVGNDFFKDIPITFLDGSSTVLKDFEIERNGLNKFKGYKCRTLSYAITMDGWIENTCTRRRAPMNLRNDGLIVTEICPHDTCPGRRLQQFYKTL
jgi:organic radical activating enzyme